ncbi:hypothetical protein [Klebsiella variicola]|uniref:hypothetical protein n=1 Tax=Klebsiella variicola TaxID=244366 RepID=UPI0035A2FDA7
MSTALSVLESFASNTGIDHSKEMNVIHEIVAECEKEIAFMHQVHDFVYGDERHNMINRLLRLNHRPDDERIAELEAVVDQRNGECVRLMKERDELLSDQLTKGSNIRAAADVYFQLMEECQIPPSGSLVEYVRELEEQVKTLQRQNLHATAS